MRTIILAILAMAMLTLVGCGKNDNQSGKSTMNKLQDKTSALVDTAQDKAVQWQKQFNTKMDQWGTQISETAAKAKAGTDQQTKQLQQQLSDKYDQAKTKLAELKTATTAQSVKLQADLAQLGADIQKLYGQVKDKLAN